MSGTPPLIGEVCASGPAAEARVGNALPLANIPVGTQIHNIELRPGKGAQIARAAGTQAEVVAKEGNLEIDKNGDILWRSSPEGLSDQAFRELEGWIDRQLHSAAK